MSDKILLSATYNAYDEFAALLDVNLHAYPSAEKEDLRKSPHGQDITLRKTSGKTADSKDTLRPLKLKPQYLPEVMKYPAYPVDALGPILGAAAKALADHVHCPAGLAGQSVLAAAALVAQCHINVARGKIGTGPVSLYCLSVADSGERKSSVDKLALRPIRNLEARHRRLQKSEFLRYKASKHAWELRKDSVIKNARPSGKYSDPMSEADESKLAQDLLLLEADMPSPPQRPNITFAEPTSEAIWRHYQQGQPTAGLFSDEGVMFFSGHGMTNEARGRMIGCMSQLWDGSTLQRTRAGEGESGELDNRRLSSHLMVQPIVSAEVLADKLLLGQGFLARFLICHEDSLAGTRFLAGRNTNIGAEDRKEITSYWERMTQLLDEPLDIDTETGGLNLRVMDISGPAFEKWKLLHDGIESHLTPNIGKFHSIKSFASKAAENAARIAAVMAFIEGSPITPEHIDRAGTIISYYLESVSIHTNNAGTDIADTHGRQLLDLINERNGQLINTDFKNLPLLFRSAQYTRSILKKLTDDGHIQVVELGRGGKPAAWELITC
jgi:hypothetical protein